MPETADLNGSTVSVFDHAGRTTASIFTVAGVEKWRTTTVYGGDRTHVTPPQGGTATTTITDVRGNTTELRQYDGPIPTGTYAATTYTYTPRDELSTVTDSVGNTWRYSYDLFGRKTSADDPDSGETTYGYDNAGNLTRTVDARGIVLSYEYDALNRKTDTFEVVTSSDGTSENVQLAHWYWDTRLKGQLTASRAYEDGITITKAITDYDDLYRITGYRYSLTGDALGVLEGSYQFGTQYNTDGTVETTGFPAAGGMSGEAVVHSYDDLGRLTALVGEKVYADNIGYYRTGQLGSITMPAGATDVYQTLTYERGSNRLATSTVTLGGATGPVSDVAYTYDPAGNITSIIDDPGTTGAQRDAQCFVYDNLRRLTSAWTSAATGDGIAACAGGSETTGVAGPAAYRHEYRFDPTGNRTELVQYPTGSVGAPSDTTTSTYTYPAPGPDADQPHTLTDVTDTVDGITTATTGYIYDDAGNTIEVADDTGTQTLTWGPEGKLTQLTETTGTAADTSTYAYDAEGKRIVRTDPDGTISLFLDGLELTLAPATASPTATRYYKLPGGNTYTRTSNTAQYQISDHHGTGVLAIDCTTGDVTRRRSDPYGNPRGTQPTDWVGSKGYVGGTNDPTGYTHLGAREYDPGTGRFISSDPLMNPADSQQINGYVYANAGPVSNSDSTGLMYEADGTGEAIRKIAPADDRRKGMGGTTRVSSGGLGAKEGKASKRSSGIAEFSMLASYMAEQIGFNAKSGVVGLMRDYIQGKVCAIEFFGGCALHVSEGEGAALAAGLWFDKVCTGCDWDHKPQIRDMINGDLSDLDSLYTAIPGTDVKVRYDIWSNIHYGYVGVEAGFDEATLIEASNVAIPGVGASDPADDIAVHIGVMLHEQYRPEEITAEVMAQAIINAIDSGAFEIGGPGRGANMVEWQ